tara:strand:+ start:279 stop:686 length:408 start_codon:yes stop_codon:yes gene_type:complete
MKAYKIKKTMVQEFVSFGETREEAIANFEYSQGHDFDQVEINGETFVNGDVIGGKVTATSLGTGNFIIFNQKDWKFAKAMWLRNHNDSVKIREYNGEISDAHELSAEQVAQDESIKQEIYEIADRYSRKLVTPVK